MRLELRGRTFIVEPDEHSWMVAELRKNQPEDRVRVVESSRAYLTTLDAVARHLLEYSLRRADAEALAELVQIARELKAEIRAIFDAEPETAPKLTVAGGRRR